MEILIPREKVKSVKSEEDVIISKIAHTINHEDFEVNNGKVFFKGIKSIEIPAILVGALMDAIDDVDTYNSLKYFTLKLLANPIPESRDTLLGFVINNDVQLTPSGNMVLYRRVVTKNRGNKILEKFVTQGYLKVKQHKKSPRNYEVYNDNGLTIVPSDRENHGYNKHVGNLHDLYTNLGETTGAIYTDNHTHTYEIKIPGVYKIREEDIDKNYKGSCGGFLHAASLSFDYSSFGDTDCLVLVNPINAAKTDTGYSSKIGVTEMYMATILDSEFQDIKNDQVINLDEEYERLTLEEIQKSLEAKSLSKFSVTDEVTELSYGELQRITKILNERIIKV